MSSTLLQLILDIILIILFHSKLHHFLNAISSCIELDVMKRQSITISSELLYRTNVRQRFLSLYSILKFFTKYSKPAMVKPVVRIPTTQKNVTQYDCKICFFNRWKCKRSDDASWCKRSDSWGMWQHVGYRVHLIVQLVICITVENLFSYKAHSWGKHSSGCFLADAGETRGLLLPPPNINYITGAKTTRAIQSFKLWNWRVRTWKEVSHHQRKAWRVQGDATI